MRDNPVEGLAREIGMLSMELSQFEAALGCAVGFLANSQEPKIGLILIAELSLKAKLALFSALYAERLPLKDRSALDAFRGNVHVVEAARNTLVHSIYWRGPFDSPHVTRVKPTAKEKQGFRLQLEEMNELSAARQSIALGQLTGQLDDLMEADFADYRKYTGSFFSLLW